MATIADRQALNTDLANDAYRSIWNLRFSGEAIPQDVWHSITEAMTALDRWFKSTAKIAPTKLTMRQGTST